jgi:hypothetical protein
MSKRVVEVDRCATRVDRTAGPDLERTSCEKEKSSQLIGRRGIEQWYGKEKVLNSSTKRIRAPEHRVAR